VRRDERLRTELMAALILYGEISTKARKTAGEILERWDELVGTVCLFDLSNDVHRAGLTSFVLRVGGDDKEQTLARLKQIHAFCEERLESEAEGRYREHLTFVGAYAKMSAQWIGQLDEAATEAEAAQEPRRAPPGSGGE
jgi:hypothetical protein